MHYGFIDTQANTDLTTKCLNDLHDCGVTAPDCRTIYKHFHQSETTPQKLRPDFVQQSLKFIRDNGTYDDFKELAETPIFQGEKWIFPIKFIATSAPTLPKIVPHKSPDIPLNRGYFWQLDHNRQLDVSDQIEAQLIVLENQAQNLHTKLINPKSTQPPFNQHATEIKNLIENFNYALDQQLNFSKQNKSNYFAWIYKNSNKSIVTWQLTIIETDFKLLKIAAEFLAALVENYRSSLQSSFLEGDLITDHNATLITIKQLGSHIQERLMAIEKLLCTDPDLNRLLQQKDGTILSLDELRETASNLDITLNSAKNFHHDADSIHNILLLPKPGASKTEITKICADNFAALVLGYVIADTALELLANCHRDLTTDQHAALVIKRELAHDEMLRRLTGQLRSSPLTRQAKAHLTQVVHYLCNFKEPSLLHVCIELINRNLQTCNKNDEEFLQQQLEIATSATMGEAEDSEPDSLDVLENYLTLRQDFAAQITALETNVQRKIEQLISLLVADASPNYQRAKQSISEWPAVEAILNQDPEFAAQLPTLAENLARSGKQVLTITATLNREEIQQRITQERHSRAALARAQQLLYTKPGSAMATIGFFAPPDRAHEVRGEERGLEPSME